ncbi:MAG: type II secretion system GspH family protein [Verrucomicrobiae bacterium]|nr:type II secretion system GspH family protein [Verrucomicrobiae bacterium]MDW8342969.1 type II secretion system protein [Verrucomicrobiae bacterium]
MITGLRSLPNADQHGSRSGEPPGRGSPRRPAGGFTLVEVVMAVAILGFVLGACLLSFSMAMRSVGTARNEMMALHHARFELERLRTFAFTNAALNAGTYSISNANYTGNYTVTSVDTHTKDITVRIFYRNHIRGGTSTNVLTTSMVRVLHRR